MLKGDHFVSAAFLLLANFWICSSLQSSGDVYNIARNPDLPSGYDSLAEATITGSERLYDCLHSCIRSWTCEASVLDKSTSSCYLFPSAFVHLSEASNPNNLIYAENVCSPTRNVRPAWCPVSQRSYQDCQAAFEYGWTEPGIFTITPTDGHTFDVWCDFDESHGWAVIQRRFDGSLDFYVDWATYKAGFGDVDGECWIGNENLYALTQTNQIMSIYLYKYNGEERTANYSTFYINDENDNYRATITGYSGDVGYDSMDQCNGMMFSTLDADNDIYGGHCATLFQSGWWHRSCHSANLNGIWTSGSAVSAANMVWGGSWGGHSGDAAMHRSTMRVTRN